MTVPEFHGAHKVLPDHFGCKPPYFCKGGSRSPEGDCWPRGSPASAPPRRACRDAGPQHRPRCCKYIELRISSTASLVTECCRQTHRKPDIRRATKPCPAPSIRHSPIQTRQNACPTNGCCYAQASVLVQGCLGPSARCWVDQVCNPGTTRVNDSLQVLDAVRHAALGRETAGLLRTRPGRPRGGRGRSCRC